ncbi:MAG: Uma2 family endonuclease [Desulfitobacteriaceae bacterium]
MSKPAGEKLCFYTYKDYLQWPENERWEIIDGLPFNMTPAPSPNHQRVLGELFSVFLLYLKGKSCEVFVAPFDVRLPRTSENDENSSTVIQPDLTIICDPHKIDRRGCLGSPDLVLEITSPGTLARDMKYKLLRYEEAGIQEYWIVHPDGKTVLVYQRSEDGQYKRPQVYTNQDRLSVGIFPDLEINLHEIFSVIPDEELI